jgi:hypothetical protein
MITRDWRIKMLSISTPMVEQLGTLKCPFQIEPQRVDYIPMEFTMHLQHYVQGQNIPGTRVQAPWRSYYAIFNGVPIVMANYAGV